MTNPFFTAGAAPVDFTVAKSGPIRAQFSAIEAGFDKVDSLVSAHVATGTANALILEMPSPPPSYEEGLQLFVKVASNNTGAATINLNELGAKPIVARDGSPLLAGDLVAGSIEAMFYVGGVFRLAAVDGRDGINGGMGSSAGDSALFAAADGMTVAPGITKVPMAGNTVAGVGAADYIYDAAVNAAYVAANPRTAFLAADGRGFKLDPNQRLHYSMFGPTSTAAERSATLRAAADFKPYAASIKYGTEIIVDQAGMVLSETLEPDGVFFLTGTGVGRAPGSAGQLPSQITGPVNQTTVRLRSNGTEGMGLSAGKKNATESRISNITITQPTGTDYTAHGIHARGTPILKDVLVHNAAGDGIVIAASFAGDADTLGNANNWLLDHCSIHTARGNGLTVGRLNGENAAADVNAGLAIHLYIHDVQRAGIVDYSFYANTYLAPQVNSSGNGGVYHAGRRWQLIVLSNTGTEPGTDGAIWYALETAAAADVNFVTWNVATTYYCELQILSSLSNFITPYAENQRLLSHNPGGIIIGGNMDWTQQSNKLTVIAGLGITNNRGIGHYRTTGGYGATHPAFAFIGVAEETVLGKPGPAVQGDLHKRAAVLSHTVDTNHMHWNYENVTGGVERDLISRSSIPGAGGRMHWAIGGAGTSWAYGRAAPVAQIFTLNDFGIQLNNDNANARIFGIRTAVPTTFGQAIGERYWSVNPSSGLDMWVCKVAGTPTTAGTFAKDYLNERADPLVGIGYVVGAGGSVTQLTDKSTGVTLNKVCGSITMSAASLAAASAVSFTLTNSAISANNVPVACIKAGATAGAYMLTVDAVGAGTCRISLRNLSGGALAEAVIISFAVIKAETT